MNRITFCIALFAIAFSAGAFAQQPNLSFSALNIDAPAGAGVPVPVTGNFLTDSKITLNVKGFPGVFPVVVLFATNLVPGGSYFPGAFQGFNLSLDLPDQGVPGYQDQEFVNGYELPGTMSFTDPAGNLSITAAFPACTVHPFAIACLSVPTFEVSSQGIVVDLTNGPFNVRTTGAGIASFTNGYKRHSNLIADNFDVFNFLAGFTFRFYGNQYTRAFVSSNGYISFTTPSGGFPNPNVGEILSGEPRIMHFYNDLEPEVPTFNGRVFSQQFTDCNGVAKIKFVHERLQEWGNPAGGPKGGETIITENDEIAIFIPGYVSGASINTGVGISPGMSVDNTTLLETPFGMDLLDAFNNGRMGRAGGSAFELYDHGNANGCNNCIDILAIGLMNGSPVGPGIVFAPDPMLPNTAPGNSGYTVD